MPILAALSPPKKILQEIDSLFSSFLWGGRKHQMSWQRVCRPHSENCLGILPVSQLDYASSSSSSPHPRADHRLQLPGNGDLYSYLCPSTSFAEEGTICWIPPSRLER